MQSCKSTPKEFSIHDHKGAYACTCATVYYNFIVNSDRFQCIATAINCSTALDEEPAQEVGTIQTLAFINKNNKYGNDETAANFCATSVQYTRDQLQQKIQ